MKLSRAILHMLLLLAFSCSKLKKDQSRIQDSTKTVGDSPDTLTASLQKDSNAQTVTLKWVEISISEHGPAYVFEDTAGKQLFIQSIEIPGFDFQKNNYFDVDYSNESMFPAVTLRKEIIGQWYLATIKNELQEPNDATREVSVITTLKPIHE